MNKLIVEAEATIKCAWNKIELWTTCFDLRITYHEDAVEVNQLQAIASSNDAITMMFSNKIRLKQCIADMIEEYNKRALQFDQFIICLDQLQEEFNQKIKPVIDSGLKINEEDAELVGVQTQISDIIQKHIQMSKMIQTKKQLINRDIIRLDDIWLGLEDTTDGETSS